MNSALKILWSNGGKEKLLLLVADAAAYMLKAGRDLKIFYPSVLHVACLVQGINKVAKVINKYKYALITSCDVA